MKAVTVSKIKKELESLMQADLIDVCMRMARYKKENKELLSYLLFDSNYEPEYINTIKNNIDLQFSEINKSNLYYAKKSIRKILRTTNKYIRYSGHKRTEVELRIHFCKMLKESGIHVHTSTTLNNLFQGQIVRINKAILMLHEDLQYDYSKMIRDIMM
jgi:hypothetical protein